MISNCNYYFFDKNGYLEIYMEKFSAYLKFNKNQKLYSNKSLQYKLMNITIEGEMNNTNLKFEKTEKDKDSNITQCSTSNFSWNNEDKTFIIKFYNNSNEIDNITITSKNCNSLVQYTTYSFLINSSFPMGNLLLSAGLAVAFLGFRTKWISIIMHLIIAIFFLFEEAIDIIYPDYPSQSLSSLLVFPSVLLGPFIGIIFYYKSNKRVKDVFFGTMCGFYLGHFLLVFFIQYNNYKPINYFLYLLLFGLGFCIISFFTSNNDIIYFVFCVFSGGFLATEGLFLILRGIVYHKIKMSKEFFDTLSGTANNRLEFIVTFLFVDIFAALWGFYSLVRESQEENKENEEMDKDFNISKDEVPNKNIIPEEKFYGRERSYKAETNDIPLRQDNFSNDEYESKYNISRDE